MYSQKKKKLLHRLEKKANKMLLKASQTLENSTGLTLGGRKTAGMHLGKSLIFFCNTLHFKDMSFYMESKKIICKQKIIVLFLICILRG